MVQFRTRESSISARFLTCSGQFFLSIGMSKFEFVSESKFLSSFFSVAFLIFSSLSSL